MKNIQDETEAALKQAQETMKQFYDRNRGESQEYKKGDKVWLEWTNITTDRPAKKT
jgi:hypothetical protein